MAEKPKAPPSPESSQSKETGASPQPSAGAPAAAPPVKPAVPAAAASPPAQVPLANELTRRYRERFGAAILGALEDRKQPILIVDLSQMLQIARYSRDTERFDLLEDCTAVDWPRREKRFDLVAQLYSFTHNTRLRLKISLGVAEQAYSLAGIWPTANWLEREVYDMFGIHFDGHPDLKRILLPEGWKGYPLRKDYGIIQQDNEWVQINLGIESGQ